MEKKMPARITSARRPSESSNPRSVVAPVAAYAPCASGAWCAHSPHHHNRHHLDPATPHGAVLIGPITAPGMSGDFGLPDRQRRERGLNQLPPVIDVGAAGLAMPPVLLLRE